ncbi:MAG TPA: hypothetical protein VGC47_05175 [Acidimicrobiia bacterium]
MPVVDEVAADYLDSVEFVAVAGRSTEEASRERAPEWFSDNLAWGYDDSIWELYEVFGQPTTFLIHDGRIIDMWFGALGEQELRQKLDRVVASTT